MAVGAAVVREHAVFERDRLHLVLAEAPVVGVFLGAAQGDEGVDPLALGDVPRVPSPGQRVGGQPAG